METVTVGRQLYYWLNHTQCQAGSCSQIESERSDQGTSSGHVHDRHPGNPGADSAVNESCLEHTCAGLHSEKGSFCLTTHLSFYGVLGFAPGHFPCKNDSRYRSWRPNSHHGSLQVSSSAQDLQCPLPPLLYDWHSPNPSPAFEIPWLHTHTRLHHSFGRCLHKRNDECEPFGVVNRITGVWLCSAANLRRQDDPDPIPEQ